MKQEIEKIVKSLNELKKVEIGGNGSNWVNIADLGKCLRTNAIDVPCKLQTYLSSMPNYFELYEDCTRSVKVVYVRVRNEQQDASVHHEKNKYRLMDWAYLRDINDFLSQLKSMAISERWSFQNGLPGYPKDAILWSYIKYTFCRLQHQNKIIYSIDGNYSAFNTGLVDNRYIAIIALFKRNKRESASSEWIFHGFVFPGEGKGKILNSLFADNAEPATYTDNAQNLIYDVTLGAPIVDNEHIIIRHIERLPKKLLEQAAPSITSLDGQVLGKEAQKEYYDNLRKYVMEHPPVYRYIVNRFSVAIELALKKVRWDYKYAVPMFYPKENRLCLLLPLCLVDDEHEDLALVVSKTPAEKYEGATMLPLDWAYADARVVSKPNCEWLDVNQIAGTVEA